MSGLEQSSAYGEWPLQPGPFAIRYPIGILHEIDFNVKDAARRISHGGMETGGFLFGRTAITGPRETVQIEAFRAIDCEHAFGPSFVLSERDLAKMREQLVESGSDPGLEGMRLLGWFVGHARNPMRLSDHEAALFDRLFPRPGQLTLLVKPERFAPSNVSFIVRGQDRKVDRDGTKIAFPLPPLSAPAAQTSEDKAEPAPVPADSTFKLPEALEQGVPALSLPVKQEEPAAKVEDVTVAKVKHSPLTKVKEGKVERTRAEVVKLEPSEIEAIKVEPIKVEPNQIKPIKTESTASEPIKLEPGKTEPVLPEPDGVKPDTSDRAGDHVEEEKAREEKAVTEDSAADSIGGAALGAGLDRLGREMAPSSGFLSLEDLRVRRLQRLERSERIEYLEPSDELPPRPPTFALMLQKPPTRMWKPLAILAIALLLIGSAFYLYEQYFPSSVPLEVDDRVNKLMVSWPPDETREAGDAFIRVDGGASTPLSPEEKVLGRAEITPTGDDVQVELIVHHWFGETRGRVRFLKPVITALP